MKIFPPTFFGAEKVCGSFATFATHGEVASILFEEGGKSVATVCFREKAHRTCLIRVTNTATQNITLHLSAQKGANIFLFLVVDNNADISLSLSQDLCESAQVHTVVLSFSSGNAEFLFQNQLCEKKAKSDFSSFFLGNQNAHIKASLQTISKVSETSGAMKMISALWQKAFCEMVGIPTVLAKAKQCTSHLSQKSVLLSPFVRAKNIPQLMISNNEVSASHKNNSVHLSEEDLFFLTTRGLSRGQSQKLLLFSLASEVLYSFPESPMKNELLQKTNHFLESHASF